MKTKLSNLTLLAALAFASPSFTAHIAKYKTHYYTTKASVRCCFRLSVHDKLKPLPLKFAHAKSGQLGQRFSQRGNLLRVVRRRERHAQPRGTLGHGRKANRRHEKPF